MSQSSIVIEERTGLGRVAKMQRKVREIEQGLRLLYIYLPLLQSPAPNLFP